MVTVSGSAALASFCDILIGIRQMPVTSKKVRAIKPRRLRVQWDSFSVASDLEDFAQSRGFLTVSDALLSMLSVSSY